MFDLQVQLDKRLAELRKYSTNAANGRKIPATYSADEIKARLKKSGLLNRSGRLRKLVNE